MLQNSFTNKNSLIFKFPLKNNLEDFANDIETSILSSVKKPKMIILNFPSNPTTQVADLSFFKRIVEIGTKYDI